MNQPKDYEMKGRPWTYKDYITAKERTLAEPPIINDLVDALERRCRIINWVLIGMLVVLFGCVVGLLT